MCLGEDYYGTFFRALYTLFQVMTGESWSEAVVRPTLAVFEANPNKSLGVAFLWVSFIIIHSVVLLNIVVTFVLDGMNQCADEAETCRLQANGDCCDPGKVSVEDKNRLQEMTELRQEINGLLLLLNETTSDVTFVFSRLREKAEKRAHPARKDITTL